MAPEKVLGVQASWAAANPPALAALIRALDKAAAWCDLPENRGPLAALLSRECYTGVAQAVLMRSLSGTLQVDPGGAIRSVTDFIQFRRNAANFPWISHALWIYSQMVRWGQTRPSAEAEAAVRGVYRPDLYRQALGAAGVPLPGANAKVEGSLGGPQHVGVLSGSLQLGPDGFFDGRVFDPDDISGYLAEFDIPDPAAAGSNPPPSPMN